MANTMFCVQFQKQGKDVERVKQRLVEIANYVDKVRVGLPTTQKKFIFFFLMETYLSGDMKGSSVMYCRRFFTNVLELNTSLAWKMQYDYLWVGRKDTSFSGPKTLELWTEKSVQ